MLLRDVPRGFRLGDPGQLRLPQTFARSFPGSTASTSTPAGYRPSPASRSGWPSSSGCDADYTDAAAFTVAEVAALLDQARRFVAEVKALLHAT